MTLHSRMFLPILALGACATDPEVDVPSVDAVDGATRAVPLAEIMVPTTDGTGAYRFAFFDTDGIIATAINVPFGQPIPEDDDCALTTFLRIAEPDAVVPPPLLAACASSRARTAGPVRVRDLGVDTRGLSFRTTLAVADCARSDFDARTAELTADAEYQPTRYMCTRNLLWDGASCYAYNAGGNLIGACNGAESFELQDHASGWYCSAHDWIPDPGCEHDSWVYGDYGPSEAWTRSSGPAATKVRMETSVCNASALTRWKQRWHSSDDWGPSYYNQVYTGLNVLTLNAGWDGDDKWNARYFSLLVTNLSQSTFHVNNAWVNLKSKNRFTCPAQI